MSTTANGFLEPASKKRLLLAAYLDFLIYESVYQPIAWLGVFGGWLEESYIKFGLFGFGFVLSWFFKKLTPGLRTLGIGYSQSWGKEAVPVVDAAAIKQERWWVVLLGVLLVLEGSKNLVRWTEGLPPQPFLGDVSSDWLLFSIQSVLGLLSLTAGIMILRRIPLGALIGCLTGIIQLGPMLFMKEQYRDWMLRVSTARRELQGLPVREGESEFLVQYVLVGMPLLIAAGSLILLVLYFKLRKDQLSEAPN